MLTELKRCNSIGSTEGLLFLITIIAGKERITQAEIRNRCALENGVTVNCPGAVAFLEYLGLVTLAPDTVMATDRLDDLALKEAPEQIIGIVKLCIKQLTEDGIFDSDTMAFDPERGHLSIKRSAFPLAYAAIRNFMTAVGALEKEQQGEIGISDDYEDDFATVIRNRRKKLTLEQLLQQQEEQSKRGLEAEEFVLRLEKNRLPAKATRIKRISDYDVSAGYDIVSFEEDGSEVYDRFLEVKCYIGEPHFFWSENEVDVARIKGERYILCLVDYTQIGHPSYQPEYIVDPAGVIFESDAWMVNTASYRIQKV